MKDSRNTSSADPLTPHPRRPWRVRAYLAIIVLTAGISVAVTALLMNIQERKQEQRQPFMRLVAVNESTTDPVPWGYNWPGEYNGYVRTTDATRTRYGGSDAMPQQKLDRDPWLKRLFAGYAFSIDYRDRRGHAYMLTDQEQTERILKKPQPGGCLHCHGSVVATYRRVGEQAGAAPAAEGDAFNWPAVMKGFEMLCAMKYSDAHAELLKTPDGAPGQAAAAPSGGPLPTTQTTQQALATQKSIGKAHPISCVDCHDPATMQLRVTRPGFLNGIRALAASDAPTPHLPSIERWRKGDRARPYDPNVDATRQEMRSFACGQCHVEYYFRGEGKTLTYPWANGLKVEQIEAYYDDPRNFADGKPFVDWRHGETGAGVLKAQHPEFETWSQGLHARAGVSCSDCHMPYVRQGAMKISDHWVRSPMVDDTSIARSCQTCHRYPESELRARVDRIQGVTHELTERSAKALTDSLDAINAARAAGATAEQLKDALALQRKAQWRLDFVAAENSMGFHASQETARILGESIDYFRQAQIQAQNAGKAGRPTTLPAN